MLAISCLITVYCSKLLLETRKKLGASSYTEIGFILYGKWGKVAVDIALCASQTGFCCAYVYFIKENFSAIAQQAFNIDISPNYFCLFCFVLFTLMCFVRKIEIFASTHAFADLMIVLTMVTIIVYGGKEIKENNGL